MNPDHVICNMDESVELNLVLTIGKGRGYVPAEENKREDAPVGTIAIDSIFTPIRNVKYDIENFRVEQRTDYEKLILELGLRRVHVHPKQALQEAAKILIHHFMLFSDEKISLEPEDSNVEEEFDESSLHMRQLLKTKLADMDLSVRALNCLKAADIDSSRRPGRLQQERSAQVPQLRQEVSDRIGGTRRRQEPCVWHGCEQVQTRI